MEFSHISVLLNESINALNIKENGIYVDGTAGGGKVLSSDLSGLLGFGIADFVKVHCFVLLSFCTLIIAH